MNTLCGKTVLPHKDSDDATAAHVEEGVKIQPTTVGMFCDGRCRPAIVVVGDRPC